jgi:hypothetical protein
MTVFRAKSSEIGHTKTTLAAKVANFFWSVFLCWVAKGSSKNV